MTVSSDFDVVREAQGIIAKVLSKAGYGNEHPGRAWTKNQLDELGFRPDWKGQLERRVLQWAREEGLEPQKREESQARATVPPSAGYAYQAEVRVQKQVQELRLRYFGTTGAPFPNTREGYGKALMWLEAAQVEDREQLGGRYPKIHKLVITVEGVDVPHTFDASATSTEHLEEGLRGSRL